MPQVDEQKSFGNLTALNPTGQELAQIMANTWSALMSAHSGPTRPPYAVAGTLWLRDDGTNQTVMLYDGQSDHPIAMQAGVDTHTSNTSNPHATTAAQVGAPTTAQFDTFIARTDNPHSVTAAQVGAWHADNDGAGSGLDADKLDGLEASQFVRSDESSTVAGPLTFSVPAHRQVNFGKDVGAEIQPAMDFYNGYNKRLAYIQTGGGYFTFHLVGGALLSLHGEGDIRVNLAPITHSGRAAGSVGTLVLAHKNNSGDIGFGGTISGSHLTPDDTADYRRGWPQTLSGTWRCLGYSAYGRATLYIRIA